MIMRPTHFRRGIFFVATAGALLAAVATNYITKWDLKVSCIGNHNSAWKKHLPHDWGSATKLCFYHTKTWDGRASLLADQIAGESGKRVSQTSTGSAVHASAGSSGVNISGSVSAQTVLDHLQTGATVMIDEATNVIFAVLKGSDGTVVHEPVGKIRQSDGVFLRGGEAGHHCLEIQHTDKISENIRSSSTTRTGYYAQAVIRPLTYSYILGDGANMTTVSVVYNILAYEIRRRNHL